MQTSPLLLEGASIYFFHLSEVKLFKCAPCWYAHKIGRYSSHPTNAPVCCISKWGDLACCHLSAPGAARVEVAGEHERKAAWLGARCRPTAPLGVPGCVREKELTSSVRRSKRRSCPSVLTDRESLAACSFYQFPLCCQQVVNKGAAGLLSGAAAELSRAGGGAQAWLHLQLPAAAWTRPALVQLWLSGSGRWHRAGGVSVWLLVRPTKK